MTTPGSLVFSRFKFLLGLRFEELYAIDRAEKQPNLVYFDLGGILNYLSEIYFEAFFVMARRGVWIPAFAGMAGGAAGMAFSPDYA